jgi:hypothetical protein
MLAENSRVLASVRRILFGGGLENRRFQAKLRDDGYFLERDCFTGLAVSAERAN